MIISVLIVRDCSFNNQGPLGQKIVSLTKSLIKDSLSLTVNHCGKFLLKNCKELLHCKSSSHFFQQINVTVLRTIYLKF